MGILAHYLHTAFALHCPAGWTCHAEQRVLAAETKALLGYASQVGVLRARADGQRRLWIEFAMSRADSVANHAKFATAHLFQPQPATDTSVATVNAHGVHVGVLGDLSAAVPQVREMLLASRWTRQKWVAKLWLRLGVFHNSAATRPVGRSCGMCYNSGRSGE